MAVAVAVASSISQLSEITAKKQEFILALAIILPIFYLCYKLSIKATSPLPPGPLGLPLLGYLPFLHPNLHHEFTKIAQRYGPIFKLKLGSKILVVVNSSDLARAVVREQDDVFANRDPPIAATIISYGNQDIVWSNNNAYWRNLRKVFVSQVLSNNSLEASRTFRRSAVRKTINHVHKTMGKEVDIGSIAFTTTLGAITTMLWGKTLVDDEKGNELREVISKIVELLGAPNLSDFFPVLSRFDLQGVEKGMKEQLKKMDGIFGRIIEERMSVQAVEAVEQQGRKDLLQILLEIINQPNTASSIGVTQIKALFMDIIIGATDTTTTMIEWTMSELLQNPKVMKKVQEEIQQVVGLDNIVEESHHPKLCHLDAIIKETFRLHPPVPLLIGRSPNQPCKVGGYTVPKGSTVYLNVWAMHRDPSNWNNPSKFDHGRFLNPQGQTSGKFDYIGTNSNYIPFGSGRRRCPGILLGEKMLVYLLASLLHSFDWSLANDKQHDLSDKFGIVLKKKDPLIAIPSGLRLPHNKLYM